MSSIEQEQSGGHEVRPVILASSSPRRREILGRVGLPFRVVPADVDEEAFASSFQGSYPELVEALAVAKARAVALSQPEFDGLILAADTTVIVDSQMLAKPRDADEARAMLTLLRGRMHEVATGVALYDCRTHEVESAYRCTTVWMRAYTDEEIAAYVATGDPLDKAGAYAVQHEIFQPVEWVEGCYLSVVGLPLCLVVRLLRSRGVAVAPLRADGNPSGCVWSPRCQPPLPPGAMREEHP